MDVFDRLGQLLKSFLDDTEEAVSHDTDYASAWEELERYMGSGVDEPFSAGSTRSTTTAGGRSGAYRPPRPIPESLRQDYRNLEVHFGAEFNTVRKAYRSLMVTYHPDRYANDPKKAQIATEITKKISESYRRIKSFHEEGR